MTISTGLAALQSAVAAALVQSGFLASTEGLEIDSASDLEPSGDETALLTWSALTRGETRAVRTLLGLPVRRHVVEHRAVLDLAWAGPDRAAGEQVLGAALAAVAVLPNTVPTLGGAVERFFIEGGEDLPLPPNGWRTSLICAFRVRSGDPLGLTP